MTERNIGKKPVKTKNLPKPGRPARIPRPQGFIPMTRHPARTAPRPPARPAR